jgi:hypothetical protein
MAIFVVGMHRSGTSMVASVLQTLGVQFGAEEELLPANQSNLAGYYENKRILAINDALMAANSLTWRTLPAITSKQKVEGADEYLSAADTFSKRFEDGPLWGVKDPRLSFFLPFWKAAAPSSSVVICVRNPASVALSLNTRNDIALPYGAAIWELYTIAALKNSRRMPRTLLIYEQMLNDPRESVRKIISGVPELSDTNFSREQVEAAAEKIRSDLDHSDDQTVDQGFLTDRQIKLYERLTTGVMAVSRSDEKASVSAELVRLETGHQMAKSAIGRANAELTKVKATLDQERVERSLLLDRIKTLTQLFYDGDVDDSSSDSILDTLRCLLRRLNEPPTGFVRQKTVDEMMALKDDRNRWLQSELDAASVRAGSVFEKLQIALGESLDLRIRLTEAERVRESSERALASMEAAHSQNIDDLSATREESQRSAAELHSTEIARRALEIELGSMREQYDRVRREFSVLAVELDQARSQESSSRVEARRLKQVEVELRNDTLIHQQRSAELARQLAEKERAEARLLAMVGELTEQVARTNRSLQESAREANDLANRETKLRNALEEKERAYSGLIVERDALLAECRKMLTTVEESRLALDRERTLLLAEVARDRETIAAERRQIDVDTQAERRALDEERTLLLAEVARDRETIAAERRQIDVDTQAERRALDEERTLLLAQVARDRETIAAERRQIDVDTQAERRALDEERTLLLAEVARDSETIAAERRQIDIQRSRTQSEQKTLLSELIALERCLHDVASSITSGQTAIGEASSLSEKVALFREIARSIRLELENSRSNARDLSSEVDQLRLEVSELRGRAGEGPAQDLKALKVQAIALTNATQIIASLEAEVEELKKHVRPLQSLPEMEGAIGTPAPAGWSPEQATALIERLRNERDGLEKALAAARKANANVEKKEVGATHAPSAPTEHLSPVARERLARQLAAMQDLASAIDVLLAPKIGGRFWIPVRKIRVKLSQLRQILDIESLRSKRY